MQLSIIAITLAAIITFWYICRWKSLIVFNTSFVYINFPEKKDQFWYFPPICYICKNCFLNNFSPFVFRWNQLDVFIVGLSVAGIVLEKMENDLIPINPTIIRVFRVMRIARGNSIKLFCFNCFIFMWIMKYSLVLHFFFFHTTNSRDCWLIVSYLRNGR